MIPGFLKNTLINTALKRVAKAGDGGSTILGTLVTLLLAEKIDWDLAFKIFSNSDMPAALEAGKILGILLLLGHILCLRQEEARRAAAGEAGMTAPPTIDGPGVLTLVVMLASRINVFVGLTEAALSPACMGSGRAGAVLAGRTCNSN